MHPDDVRFCIQTSRLLAHRSRATRAKVGCVIWDEKKRTIISVGYNGTAPGESNLMEHNGKTLPTVRHAEWNALEKLHFWQSWGKTMFVTHSPCESCARNIKKRGIHHVYYLENYGTAQGLNYLREHQIPVHRIMMLP